MIEKATGLLHSGNAGQEEIIKGVAGAFPGTHVRIVQRAVATVLQDHGRGWHHSGRHAQRPGMGAAPAPEGAMPSLEHEVGPPRRLFPRGRVRQQANRL